MLLNDSIHYIDSALYCDDVPVAEIVASTGTPVYIYSLRRALHNYMVIKRAFKDFNTHIHYSAKANANLTILRTLIEAGAGIDVVSAGELYRALKAGAKPDDIVFAGVGKTPDEIRYALEQGVGWFNVENVQEVRYINDIAASLGREGVKVALRFNPEVTATTHPYIATGHGGAKFGLTANAIRHLLDNHADYSTITFSGIHIHIGSQLHDVNATSQAVEKALSLAAPYPSIRTLNMGGGFPASYKSDEVLPSPDEFANNLRPLLADTRYDIILEPGRSIIADAGILVTKLLYIKQQAGEVFYIVDASMTELIRPALYQAEHEIIPVVHSDSDQQQVVQVVGPVCETADVLGRNINLPELQPDEHLAILTAGAYGMVMASNYNARLRPAEVAVHQNGYEWTVIRRRETFEDLLAHEVDGR